MMKKLAARATPKSKSKLVATAPAGAKYVVAWGPKYADAPRNCFVSIGYKRAFAKAKQCGLTDEESSQAARQASADASSIWDARM